MADDQIDKITTVRLAGLIYCWLQERAQQRERQLIDQLVAAYRAGGLQESEMRSKIGEISAVRFMVTQAQKEANKPVRMENDG